MAFEALGGVDDAAECRHAVDSDILEFVTVAVERRLMGHARIERIAQGRILLRDVPAMHAHLPPGGGMPPSPPLENPDFISYTPTKVMPYILASRLLHPFPQHLSYAKGMILQYYACIFL